MMKRINSKKDQKLKKERGFSVEEIVSGGSLLDVLENPNYEDQFYYVFSFENYAWIVVVGQNPNRYITHYKSRKAKKRYGI